MGLSSWWSWEAEGEFESVGVVFLTSLTAACLLILMGRSDIWCHRYHL